MYPIFYAGENSGTIALLLQESEKSFCSQLMVLRLSPSEPLGGNSTNCDINTTYVLALWQTVKYKVLNLAYGIAYVQIARSTVQYYYFSAVLAERYPVCTYIFHPRLSLHIVVQRDARSRACAAPQRVLHLKL